MLFKDEKLQTSTAYQAFQVKTTSNMYYESFNTFKFILVIIYLNTFGKIIQSIALKIILKKG